MQTSLLARTPRSDSRESTSVSVPLGCCSRKSWDCSSLLSNWVRLNLIRIPVDVEVERAQSNTKLCFPSSFIGTDINVETKAWVPGSSTHLVVRNNKLTEKTFQALVQGAYLVNTSWLDALRACLNESWKTKGTVFNSPLESEFPIPPPPALQDAPIDWQPNPARISLFEHHRFISLTEPKVRLTCFQIYSIWLNTIWRRSHTFYIL